MAQEEQQVNVINWLIEQLQQYNNISNINPIALINLKYEAMKIYNDALHEEFKRGLHVGRDIGKQVWGN